MLDQSSFEQENFNLRPMASQQPPPDILLSSSSGNLRVPVYQDSVSKPKAFHPQDHRTPCGFHLVNNATSESHVNGRGALAKPQQPTPMECDVDANAPTGFKSAVMASGNPVSNPHACSNKPPILPTSTSSSSCSSSAIPTFPENANGHSNPNSGPADTTSAATAAKPRSWCLDDFLIGRQLGKGQFGEVFLAKEKASGRLVAIKMVDKATVLEKQILHLLKNEIEIQCTLRHPNILRLYAYFFDKQRVYLVLEYAQQGHLWDALKKVGRFSERKAAKYISALASALEYLHGQGVWHRDIKPENLLLDKEGVLKLADFGTCVRVQHVQDRRATLIGTLDYLPPEMIAKEPSYSFKADVWSLGAILYEFLVGTPPFFAKDDTATMDKIRTGEFEIPADAVSPLAADLIRKLLVLDDSQRLSVAEILHHPWIQQHTTTGLTAPIAAVKVMASKGTMVGEKRKLGDRNENR